MSHNALPKKSSTSIPIDKWFRYLTGHREDKWRQNPFNLKKDHQASSMVLENDVSGKIYQAGEFEVLPLEELFEQIKNQIQKEDDIIPFIIITRGTQHDVKYVDVAYQQAHPSNKGDTFQVASNFNGLEAIDVTAYPTEPNFVTHYIRDLTQGPAASISAGPAAISRMYAAFYDPKTPPVTWQQTNVSQVNFLEHFNSYIPIENGYVTLTPQVKPWTSTMKKKIGKVHIGIQRHAQVTFAERKEGRYRVVDDPTQIIHQVFTAAINVRQGPTGMMNNQIDRADGYARVKFILRAAYMGTYMAALSNHSPKLFLTLVGGGAFGNPLEFIIGAMLRAHASLAKKKTKLKAAILLLYPPLSALGQTIRQFKEVAEALNIPMKHYHYEKGKYRKS